MQATNRIPNVLCGFLAVIVIASQMSAAAGIFAVQAGERQLFLDDVGITEMERVSRTMHRPAKKGAVIRPDPSQRHGVLQTRSAPFWDPQDKVFKFWLLTDRRQRTSLDGLHWTMAPDQGQKPPGEVFYDPTDPDAARRYKAFSPTKLAVSPDGNTWTVLKVPPIPSSDEHNCSLDQKNRLYIATVKQGGPYGRSVGLSTSKDFEHWTKPELMFHADELDQKLGRENIKARMADPTLGRVRYNVPARYNVDVYNMGVFRYESLYIGTPAMFHTTGPVPNYPNTDGFHLVQLACSRDLKSWKRLGDRKPFIGLSRRDSGAYDVTGMIGPSNAVVRGDKLWFYYSGHKYRGEGSDYVGQYPNGKWVQQHGFDTDTGAICLAVLRRDGFISLDAGDTKGTVQTKPFTAAGGKLFINADAFNGELRVEVLGENGKVLAVSKPMKGDLPRGEVKWRKGDIADLKGNAVSLRFTLRNASLYSYWLQ